MESTQRKPVPRAKIALGLLAILIVVLFLWYWIPYRNRESAIAALAPLNAEIIYGQGGPRWLRLFIGHRRMQAFDYVQGVKFKESQVSDADLVALRKFPRLDELTLVKARITDEGLRSIGEIPSLTKLLLTGTQVTDAGMVHLSKMKFLHRLSLADTKITDAGVAALAPLKKLDQVSLANTVITDASLETLVNFRKMESLDLSGTRITDAGILQHMKVMDSLHDANFANTPVTSAGLKELRQYLTGANLIRIPTHVTTPSAAKSDAAKDGGATTAAPEKSAAGTTPSASGAGSAPAAGESKPPAASQKK